MNRAVALAIAIEGVLPSMAAAAMQADTQLSQNTATPPGSTVTRGGSLPSGAGNVKPAAEAASAPRTPAPAPFPSGGGTFRPLSPGDLERHRVTTEAERERLEKDRASGAIDSDAYRTQMNSYRDAIRSYRQKSGER